MADQARRFIRNHQPSHMWLVSAQYFCTSYSLAAEMMAGGFSCPSTTWVCNAEYTSEKLMLVGAAPRDWNSEVQSALIGTRIFSPLRSSGVWIGLVLVVTWRKPLSQTLSITSSPALRICPRSRSPSFPSKADHSVA